MNNWFDIAVLVLLLIVFIKGFQKGLIRMAIELGIVIFSTIFGGKLAERILPTVESLTNLSSQWASVTSYIISFVAIAIALSIVGQVIQKVIRVINLNFINRIGGGIISMGIAMIILSIVLNLILVLDKDQQIMTPATTSSSFFYEGVLSVVPATTPYLKFDLIEGVIPEEYIEQFDKINNGIIDSAYQKRYFSTDSI